MHDPFFFRAESGHVEKQVEVFPGGRDPKQRKIPPDEFIGLFPEALQPGKDLGLLYHRECPDQGVFIHRNLEKL